MRRRHLLHIYDKKYLLLESSWNWFKVKSSESVSCWVVSNSSWLHGLSLPSSYVHGIHKNMGVRSHSRLQGIFWTQGLNPGLLHGRQILHHLSPKEAPNQFKPKANSLLVGCDHTIPGGTIHPESWFHCHLLKLQWHSPIHALHFINKNKKY